ncbi:MAG: SurA N-terminal domain-containing protein [Gammaproteobacteria bacterium]|nr:SurA N-terminal domain-containing protein [Gammaproteobacteria bacterium]
MLQLIRNRLSGWLASAVVLLFCIPFALWGVNYYFDANVNPAVATVNGEEILLDDFRRLMDEQRRAVKPDSPEAEKALKRELLDSLVLGQLVLGFADDSGMRISAGDVVREIQGMESFQEEGFFSQELYRQVLSYRGQFRPAEFEEQMRQDLMGRQVQAALVRSSFVLEDEARWGARMRLQSRDIAYVVFPAAELREEMAVDDEDIENYYQKHTEKYHRPEEVRIAYLELSAAGLEEEVAVEEEALQAFYERRSDDYDIEEERKLTRLYIQSPGDAEEAERERARARVEALLADAEAGDSLEDLAERAAAEDEEAAAEESETEESEETAAAEEPAAEESEETAAAEESAAEESEETAAAEEPAAEESEETAAAEEPAEDKPPPAVELVTHGFLKKGSLPAEIDEAAFAMETGEVRGVIETDSGFHIIRLDEQKEGRVSTFENSREDAEKDFREQEADRLFLERAELLERYAYEEPGTLEPTAEALALLIRYSDYFSRAGGEGIAAEAAVVEAAFSGEVLSAGNNSPLIELSEERVLVLRIDEHHPRHRLPLEDAHGQIEAALKAERAAEQVRQRGQEIVERLQTGEDMEEVAAEEDFQWQRKEGVLRDSTEVSLAVLRFAFRLGRPAADGKPLFGGGTLGSGDYALIALLAVNEIEDDSALDAEELDAGWQELSVFYPARDWQEAENWLRAGASIETLQEEL